MIDRRFPRRRSIECTLLKLWELNALYVCCSHVVRTSFERFRHSIDAHCAHKKKGARRNRAEERAGASLLLQHRRHVPQTVVMRCALSRTKFQSAGLPWWWPRCCPIL